MSAPEVTAATVPTREHPEVGWLWEYVGGDWRPELVSPWTLRVKNHAPRTVVTDGHLMVIRVGDYGFPDLSDAKHDQFLNVMEKPSRAEPRLISLDTLRAFVGVEPDRAPCERCESGGSIECPECKGEGFFECDGECVCCGRACNDEADCKPCKGSGVVDCDAEGCAWKTRVTVKPVRIGVGEFNAIIVRAALENLPGDVATWRQADGEHMARMEAGPWTLIWTPLRPDNSPDVPRIEFVDDAAAVTP